MKTIPAGEFKQGCLRILDEVGTSGEPIVITKRGKPVAKLVPVEDEARREIFGCMRGTITIQGDIISPVEVDWHAERGILYIGEDDDRG